MPANLTPEYEKAELLYREATHDRDRLVALQEMLSAIPKHKGTEKMQADLKRRISQLRKEEQKSSHGKGPDPFHIPKSGAGQVVLVGPPNSGKSSLLVVTTNAAAKVADYPFTTVVPQPGMWHQEDVQIELVDTPAITLDHLPTGLIGTIRHADVIAVVVECGDAALDQTETALQVLAARGIALASLPCSGLATDDPQLHPGLVVATKTDSAGFESARILSELYSARPAASGSAARPGLDIIPVSTRTRQGLDVLFKRLWELLGRVRVYSKEPGKAPDMHKPFILPAGSSIADLARFIHRDLPDRMKFARLWGHSRFEGQQVHKNEPLRDRDIVEIHE